MLYKVKLFWKVKYKIIYYYYQKELQDNAPKGIEFKTIIKLIDTKKKYFKLWLK